MQCVKRRNAAHRHWRDRPGRREAPPGRAHHSASRRGRCTAVSAPAAILSPRQPPSADAAAGHPGSCSSSPPAAPWPRGERGSRRNSHPHEAPRGPGRERGAGNQRRAGGQCPAVSGGRGSLRRLLLRFSSRFPLEGGGAEGGERCRAVRAALDPLLSARGRQRTWGGAVWGKAGGSASERGVYPRLPSGAALWCLAEWAVGFSPRIQRSPSCDCGRVSGGLGLVSRWVILQSDGWLTTACGNHARLAMTTQILL